MIRLPLTDEERADYQKKYRKVRRGAAFITFLCGAVWGWTVMTPSSTVWMNYLDAINCVLITLSSLGMWRLVRKYRLRLEGRSFPLGTDVFGLVVIVFPRKEGDNWQVIQWRQAGILNVLAPVLEPTGRGPTIAHALHELMVSVEPGFYGIPPEHREDYLAKMNADLMGKLEAVIEEKASSVPEAGVE